MIDIHCHILCGMDDGPAEIAGSIEMARIAAADGITHIVATPHVKDDIYSAGLITQKAEELNSRLHDEGVELTVLHGADVNAMLSPELLGGFGINGTPYILIEFPHSHMPMRAAGIVTGLIASGFNPIVTHPERNGSVLKDPAQLTSLLEAGALAQITAGSLTGEFGPQIRQCAEYLLAQGAVSFIATDAHSTDFRRPVLSEGLEAASRIIGEKGALRLVRANPQAVINGEPLER